MLEIAVTGGLALACAAGLVRAGGATERAGAVILAAGACVLVLRTGPGLALAADLATVVLLGRLAWKAPRTWPVWALACHAIAAAASLAFVLQPDVGPETWRRALFLTHAGAALALTASLWRPRVKT